ncbi:MAG: extracellular solute-binding protein [Hyphomicrobiaceae bacterium]|nr:extracellular solute-binding protein [Anaerolineae bacterium]MCC0024410.1 extracellular solute-binding protein [Hyphomicrobiaceae bacterium]
MNKWLVTLSFAAVSAVLPTHASAVELTLWAPNNFTPAHALPDVGELYQELYDQFQAENPDIELNYELLPGGENALQQVLTAVGTGNLPDVAVLDGFWIARLVQTGELQPLDDFWSEESRALFAPGAVNEVTFDGNVYASWFYTAWRGLYYRKSVAESLGYSEVPTDLDEFLEFAAKAREAGMDAVLLPSVEGEATALHLESMFWGLGGELVDETGKPIFFESENRDILAEVYGIYKTLVDEGYMRPDVATLDEGGIRPYFYSGETALVAQSSSSVVQMYTDMPDLEGDIAAVNYPLPDGAIATPVLVGWTYGMFADDPEKQAAAWKFIEFMIRPDNLGLINESSGQLPVVEDIWNRDFFTSDPLMRQFKGIFDSGGMKARPGVPIYPTLSAALSSQISSIIVGSKSIDQAIDDARDVVMAEYERQTNR